MTKDDLPLRAKEANDVLLLSKPNTIGLDVGFRTRNGESTDERVVIVFVTRKLEPHLLDDADLIPGEVEVDGQGIAVDVVEQRPLRFLADPFRLRTRPLSGGASVSIETSFYTGTLGTCVTRNDGSQYLLTCWHIIGWAEDDLIWPFSFSRPSSALHDLGDAGRVDPGFPRGITVIQPGRLDGGSATNDSIADFGGTAPSVPLLRGTSRADSLANPNEIDAALARVTDGFDVANREIHWLGYTQLLSVKDDPWKTGWPLSALIGRKVCKMGRTTGFTTGRVASTSTDGIVDGAYMKNQIRIVGGDADFALPGDSGALVVDIETRIPVGVLCAGNPATNVSLVSPIKRVMQLLDIQFI